MGKDSVAVVSSDGTSCTRVHSSRSQYSKRLYAPATAAADVGDLGYMVRLGLWGKGTAFDDFKAFEEEINKAGVGMMEVGARHGHGRCMALA